jgi:choice-of-anchor B domain-containing protein
VPLKAKSITWLNVYVWNHILIMKFIIKLIIICLCTGAFAQNVNNTFRDAIYYPGKTCANVWGYVDSLQNEYALVGVSDGMRIVNVTNPDSIWEVKKIPGPNNLWKEIRTYQHFAYCVSEGGQGLQIINLRNLPDTNISYHYWTPTINGNQLSMIHALHIDTATAYIYLYGCHAGFTGSMIAKLNNPDTPTYRGNFNAGYVHDGIVKNNIMYAAMIYSGFVRFVNVSVDSLPLAIGGIQTPGAFSHNTWLSDDSKYMFTTDEINNSFLTCYNIEDFQNVELTDKIQSNPGSNSVVHNTYFKNDYCFTSWYKDGYTIVDASRKHNLIQVGNYDTFNGNGGGTDGNWGVYPYLPSGNILLSSIDTADNTTVGSLVVVSPNLQRACYFEGLVNDSITGFPLNNVHIKLYLNNDTIHEYTALNGSFATGSVTAGSYSAICSKNGYFDKTVTNIQLQNGVLNTKNILMVPLDAGIKSNMNDEKLAKINCIDRALIIEFEKSTSHQIVIYDLAGKALKTLITTENKYQTSLQELSTGIYTLKITDDKGRVQTQKLLL